MRRTTVTQVASVLLLLFTGWPMAAQVTIPEGEIARAILDGSPQERAHALAVVHTIPVSQRGSSIRSALLQELHREHEELEAARRALRSGRPIPPRTDHGESLFSVLDLVVEYDDPGIIQPLLPFIGTGNRVMNAIAAFGELAVQDVVSVAASASHEPRDVSSALLVLTRMLSRPVDYPLTTASERQIIEIAKERLRGTQAPTVVLRAIELATTTGDPDARRRVEVLAEDANALREMGIGEADLIDRIRNHAMSALTSSRR